MQVLPSVQEKSHSKWILNAEAQSFVDAGATPEYTLFQAVPADGIALKDLKVRQCHGHNRSYRRIHPPV